MLQLFHHFLFSSTAPVSSSLSVPLTLSVSFPAITWRLLRHSSFRSRSLETIGTSTMGGYCPRGKSSLLATLGCIYIVCIRSQISKRWHRCRRYRELYCLEMLHCMSKELFVSPFSFSTFPVRNGATFVSDAMDLTRDLSMSSTQLTSALTIHQLRPFLLLFPRFLEPDTFLAIVAILCDWHLVQWCLQSGSSSFGSNGVAEHATLLFPP